MSLNEYIEMQCRINAKIAENHVKNRFPIFEQDIKNVLQQDLTNTERTYYENLLDQKLPLSNLAVTRLITRVNHPPFTHRGETWLLI